MQTPKGRTTAEVPQKVSPRVVRQLKTTSDADSVSPSSLANRTPKERSPKVVERRSPRSPVSEKKRPSRISELESQVGRLQDDLKKTREQLSSSVSGKKQAEEDAEQSKKQLVAISSKLEESEKQILELSASEGDRLTELEKISEEREWEWQSELEAIKKQRSLDSAALASAVNEIQRLKAELETVAESEAVQTKHAESVNMELQSLKGNLAESLSLVEDMKNQLQDCKKSEAQAQALVGETLLQLGTAKATVESLRMDGIKAMESYSSITSELDQSRARVNLLESLVSKLEADLSNAGRCSSQNLFVDKVVGEPSNKNQNAEDAKYLEEELCALRSEVGRLRSALEVADSKYNEDRTKNVEEIMRAHELVEQIKSESSCRESELRAELEKAKTRIEDLKASLMDKETELQGVLEENEGLNLKTERNLALQKESATGNELNKLKEEMLCIKAKLMDKETELQSISEDNAMLKEEIKKEETDSGKVNEHVSAELEATRAAECEALMKLNLMMEEVEKSNKRAARVTEQLEAAQASNSEMEADLRRLKVQTDQWRKAAEAAAAMVSAGNNGKFVERTGSLDSGYNSVAGKMGSPYADDMDDDLLKKKNGNVLKKFGVLWKKQHK